MCTNKMITSFSRGVIKVSFMLVFFGCGSSERDSGYRGSRLFDTITDGPTFTWTTLQNLGATGLFADFGPPTVDGSLAGISQLNRPYEPAFPLWSDGLLKRRWIQLPVGSKIDTSDINSWIFPVGTKLWKEFALGNIPGESPRVLETRFIHKIGEGSWEFGTYVDRGSEGPSALLSGDLGTPGIGELAPGISHEAPAFDHCTYCHSKGGDPVLGFGAIQLGSIHREGPIPENGVELAALISEGRFSVTTPARIEIVSSSDIERKLVGYMQANCSGCHSPRGSVRRFQLDLSFPLSSEGATKSVDVELSKLVNKPAEIYISSIPGFPGFQKLIDPGKPETSILFHRISVRQNPEMMPKIGTSLPDTEFVELVRSWISAMPANNG